MSSFSVASSSYSSGSSYGPTTPLPASSSSPAPPHVNYSHPFPQTCNSTPKSHPRSYSPHTQTHTHTRSHTHSHIQYPSSSSSITTLDTPPDSLRSYAKALQASMARGMQVAMADLSDKARETERAFDTEFGYEDENPIDRHVRLFLTPRRASIPRKLNGKVRSGLEVGIGGDDAVDVELEMLGESPDMGKEGNGAGMGLDESFRPGLIKFTRTNSNLDRPVIPAFKRTISDEYGFGGLGMDTPGSDYSVQSEASFEAIKPDDYVSLYGDGSGSDRSSCTSTVTTASSASSSTITSRHSDGMERLGAAPKRPSLLRPKGGSRGRISVHPYENLGAGLGKEENEEEWLKGRTISETMVAQAGLRSQRGRAGRVTRV